MRLGVSRHQAVIRLESPAPKGNLLILALSRGSRPVFKEGSQNLACTLRPKGFDDIALARENLPEVLLFSEISLDCYSYKMYCSSLAL